MGRLYLLIVIVNGNSNILKEALTMARRFRVTANFPVLGNQSHQSVIVEASSWGVALGKAAREFKRMPVMRRRRVTALSLVVEQMENGQPITNPGQGQLEAPEGAQPVSEETVMEGGTEDLPSDEELAQADAAEANAEAERLINEGS